MKFLKDKPAYMMDGIDFIELTVGEKDRLVSLTVGDYISGRNGDGISLIEEAKQLFKSVRMLSFSELKNATRHMA